MTIIIDEIVIQVIKSRKERKKEIMKCLEQISLHK